MPDKTRISVVDNDEDIIEIVKYIFRDSSDYRFKFFLKGEDFTQDLKVEQFLDLAILDVRIEPWFDVIDAIEIISDLYPMAYVIILSNDTDPKKLKKFIKLGVFDFIEKVGDGFMEELKESVARAHKKILFRKRHIANGI